MSDDHNLIENQSAYSETNFWNKVVNVAKKAGYAVIEKALHLYYVLREPTTPTWAKGVCISALAYFISPIDAIPDMTPVIGYADDLGVLIAAITAVSGYITPEIREKAKQNLIQWFGNSQKDSA